MTQILRDLEGTRLALLATAAFTVVVAPFPLDVERVFLRYSPLHALLFVFSVAAGTIFLVASLLWVRSVLQNQERLGDPLPRGTVWLRLIAGSIIPVVGALLLFQFAREALRSTGGPAGRIHAREPWFVRWFVSYLLASALGFAAVFWPVDWLLYVRAVCLAVAWVGFARFLTTVQRNHEQAAGQAGAPLSGPVAVPVAVPVPMDDP